MSDSPARPTIKDLNLEEATETSLYLELIRIIEKDIDAIKESNAKTGWTSWALVGAIAGAVLLLFGETRKLDTFPTQDVQTIWLAGILLINTAILIARSLRINSLGIRPGRIRWSHEENATFLPVAAYRTLYFIAGAVIVIILPLPHWVTFLVGGTFAFWALIMGLALTVSLIKYPLGASRIAKRSGLFFIVTISLLSLASLAALVLHIKPPVGEGDTVPFMIAALITAIVMLAEMLLANTAPPRLLSSLQDLRNDIIFLRADIDQALRRYEILSEGEALPDALQGDLGDVLGDMEEIEHTYANMSALISKMEKSVPSRDEADEIIKEKFALVRLDAESYGLHAQRCSEIIKRLGTKIEKLRRRMNQLSIASDDWTSNQSITATLNQRLTLLIDKDAELARRYNAFRERFHNL
jgi:hypothetical protein